MERQYIIEAVMRPVPRPYRFRLQEVKEVYLRFDRWPHIAIKSQSNRTFQTVAVMKQQFFPPFRNLFSGKLMEPMPFRLIFSPTQSLVEEEGVTSGF